jgi:hypothetical protein
MEDELRRIWKEMVMSYFEVIFFYSSVRLRDTTEKSQSG